MHYIIHFQSTVSNQYQMCTNINIMNKVMYAIESSLLVVDTIQGSNGLQEMGCCKSGKKESMKTL